MCAPSAERARARRGPGFRFAQRAVVLTDVRAAAAFQISSNFIVGSAIVCGATFLCVSRSKCTDRVWHVHALIGGQAPAHQHCGWLDGGLAGTARMSSSSNRCVPAVPAVPAVSRQRCGGYAMACRVVLPPPQPPQPHHNSKSSIVPARPDTRPGPELQDRAAVCCAHARPREVMPWSDRRNHP